MSELVAPPAGFRIGHWTDEVGRTGCTVVIAPEGTRGGVDVRGGGPGTRETDVVSPFAGTDRVSAVMLAGGSAYGLAAADGAMRWLEEHGIGYPTPAALVPIVPAAIAYDLAEGDARRPADGGVGVCGVRGRAGRGAGAWAGRGGDGHGGGEGAWEGRGDAIGSGICGRCGRLWRDGRRACGGESVRRCPGCGRIGACRAAGGWGAADGGLHRRAREGADRRGARGPKHDARLRDDGCSARQGGVLEGGARSERGDCAGGRAGVLGRGWRRGLLPGER